MTRWSPIRGFEGRYEVSDDGRVKVLAAPGRGRPNRDRELKLGTTTTGYVQVLLYPGAGKPPVARRIHHLVLEHFVADRPHPDLVGRHLDDNRMNNHYANLAWGSLSDNTFDQVRNGVHNHASKTHCKWGHPLSGSNLYVTRKQRVCRACAARRRAEYEERQHALAVYAADTQLVASDGGGKQEGTA